MLGRKQSVRTDAEWQEAIDGIEKTVTKAELDALIDRTTEEIKKMCAEKKAAFSWSGGKDSLALQYVCEAAGITECVLVISDLEYPAFLRWVTEHMPDGLTVINTGQDLQWLQIHEEMIFPQDNKTAGKWFQIVQHRGQAQYYKENDLDILILGRRKADGNYVGRGTNIYTNSKGITRYSPLSEWRHEDVLAYMHYYDPALPPFYSWKNGYYCGTHPWPARQWTGSIENGWQEVYDIDSSIVEKAADYIPGAKKFLEGRK